MEILKVARGSVIPLTPYLVRSTILSVGYLLMRLVCGRFLACVIPVNYWIAADPLVLSLQRNVWTVLSLLVMWCNVLSSLAECTVLSLALTECTVLSLPLTGCTALSPQR